MIVKNILLGRRGNVVTIDPTADLAAAVKLLAERRIGAVVILGADHRIVGILSERDIVRALAEHGSTALNEPVGQVMTRDVKTCSEDDNSDRPIPRQFRPMSVITSNSNRIAAIRQQTLRGQTLTNYGPPS